MNNFSTILCLIMTILCFFFTTGMIISKEFVIAAGFMFFTLVFAILFGIMLKEERGNK